VAPTTPKNFSKEEAKMICGILMLSQLEKKLQKHLSRGLSVIFELAGLNIKCGECDVSGKH